MIFEKSQVCLKSISFLCKITKFDTSEGWFQSWLKTDHFPEGSKARRSRNVVVPGFIFQKITNTIMRHTNHHVFWKLGHITKHIIITFGYLEYIWLFLMVYRFFGTQFLLMFWKWFMPSCGVSRTSRISKRCLKHVCPFWNRYTVFLQGTIFIGILSAEIYGGRLRGFFGEIPWGISWRIPEILILEKIFLD